MGIRATFAAAMPDMFQAAGETAVYTPAAGAPVDCMVFIEFDVALQPAGTEAQIWQQGTTVEALLSASAGIGIGTTEPNRGDTFVVDGVTYTVREILQNDGLTVKMQVA